MYAAIPYFQSSNDHIEYEKWKNDLEEFFSYFILTSEQNYHNAQMKLVGRAYWWWKDSHINDKCWFVLQDHLHTLYALHLLYVSEVDCKEPNVEYEPELEKPQFSDLVAECKENLADVGNLLASYAAKVDSDLESTVLIEPAIIDKPESEAVDEPELEPEVVDEVEPDSEVIAESAGRNVLTVHRS